jgi:Mrp family chromosome partitioning ATPase
MLWGDGPPEVAGIAGGEALPALFEQLKDRADFVLLDSPPLLRTADALNASSYVDALLIVVRLNFIRRSTLEDFRRVLDSCPPPKIGFIATGADADPGHTYSGYSYFDRDAGRSRPTLVPQASDADPPVIEGQGAERDTGL